MRYGDIARGYSPRLARRCRFKGKLSESPVSVARLVDGAPQWRRSPEEGISPASGESLRASVIQLE